MTPLEPHDNGADEIQSSELLAPSTLRDLLIQITLSRSRAIPDAVREIDLGQIGEHDARIVVEESLVDPAAEERGREIFVTPAKKLLIRNRSLKSTKENVGGRISHELQSMLTVAHYTSLANQPRDLAPRRQNRYYCGILHSHGLFNNPQSPEDLSNLFFPELNHFAQVMSFVATPLRKILVFRGKDTPEWPPDTVNRAVVEWSKLIEKHTDEETARPGNTAVASQLLINRIVQDGWLKAMAHSHDLRIFACPFDKNIAKYQDPAKPDFLQVDSARQIETP